MREFVCLFTWISACLPPCQAACVRLGVGECCVCLGGQGAGLCVCLCRLVCEHNSRMCLGPGLNLAGSPQPDLGSQASARASKLHGFEPEEEGGAAAGLRASRLHCALCLTPEKKKHRRSKRPPDRDRKRGGASSAREVAWKTPP